MSIVLGSSGDKVFCSGADLAELADDATGWSGTKARGGLR